MKQTMQGLLIGITLSLSLATVAVAAEVGQANGRITMEFDLSDQNAGESVRLWTPYPVSDRYQTITNYQVDCESCTWRVNEDTNNGHSILYAEWKPTAKDKTLTLSFVAKRHEIRQEGLKETKGAGDTAQLEKYLTATSLGPIDGEVKKLADTIVAGKEGILERAKAIYDWCCENMYREPTTVGCGKGDVCQLLLEPGGKCTDISSVFVALSRAAGIPAREIFGVRMSKSGKTDITKWQHCWAEFHLPGYGWVSVDPADVRKMMLKEELDLDSAKTDYYRKYFWGGLDPYRIALAQGRDITLIPKQAGAPLNTFGYPYVEIDGAGLNFYDPASIQYTFDFEPITSDS